MLSTRLLFLSLLAVSSIGVVISKEEPLVRDDVLIDSDLTLDNETTTTADVTTDTTTSGTTTTTTSSASTSTTSPDTTTTTSATSTTSAMPPLPDVKKGDIDCELKDDSGFLILYAKFQAQLEVSYLNKDSKVSKATVNVPATTCNGTQSVDCKQIGMNCEWVADPHGNGTWNLALTFEVTKDPSKGNLCETGKQDEWDSFDYAVTEVSLLYNMDRNLPDALKVEGDVSAKSQNGSDIFSVSSGSSYKCEAETKVGLDIETADQEGEGTGVTVKLTKYQSEAFQIGSKKDSAKFDTAKTCKEDDNGNTLVPIIVGCVLGALIVITLIAYFIGRWHQNRSNNYQTI